LKGYTLSKIEGGKLRLKTYELTDLMNWLAFSIHHTGQKAGQQKIFQIHELYGFEF
jgi:hypothetical protein